MWMGRPTHPVIRVRVENEEEEKQEIKDTLLCTLRYFS